MAWIILIALVVVSLGGLWLAKVRGGMLTACAAALLFGSAGYALQGRPTLAGSPAGNPESVKFVPLTQVRHAFFGDFTPEEHWLVLSEGLARAGNSEDAVGILQNAVRRYPGSAQLWIGLGNALVDHAHGLTPPADYAFKQAEALLPGYPGPRFFRDLAIARSGDGPAAADDLIALIRENPNASWRPMAEQLLVAIAMGAERTHAQPPR
jgi:cytochrome c-type biogenesis protein CcmH